MVLNISYYSEHVDKLRRLLISAGIDVRVDSMQFFPGSNPGDNYLSVVKQALLKARNNIDDSGNYFSLLLYFFISEDIGYVILLLSNESLVRLLFRFKVFGKLIGYRVISPLR